MAISTSHGRSTAIPIPCLIFASFVMWGITLLVIRGIESASFVNACVMVAKILGIVVFVAFAAMSFNAGIFTADFWGNVYNNLVESGQAGADAVALGTMPEQVIGCFVIIMWAFIGIEGATVLSSRARDKKHVATATIFGLLILLVAYVCMALLPYGVMPFQDVAAMSYPAATYVFEQIVPGFGGGFLSVVIIFAILGSWLSFTILPVETAQEMAEDKLLPAYWGKLNKYKSPYIGLIIVGICTQVVVVTLIVSEDAYNFAFSMCTVAIVFTWALAAAYNLKYSIEKKTVSQVVIAAVAVLFFVVGTILNGWDLLMLTCVGYLPGFVLYYLARKQQGKELSKGEIVTIVIFAIIAAAALSLVGIGTITI
ncbi:MAG: amino acid permease [Phoenicibacter congonensis]|uniref:Amino acid permease n=1 Tax=Phoenicibacter congonensis TaxID=1944646 RepID=A0AA43UAF2_9ACTN|nr:amino acid permease [Phoenicibacter congonensis]